MSRTLSSGMSDEVVKAVVRPIYLVTMNFDNSESPSELNVWTGIGDLSFNSKTYTGLGDLLSLSPIIETADISAEGLSITLTGVKQSLISIAKSHEYQGRTIECYLGAFDDNASLIADPVLIFSGFMDVMTINESGETSTINIAAENKLIQFEKTKVRRFTAEDQKIDHATDKGFEFVTAIVEKEIIWGGPTFSAGGSTGSSTGGGTGNIAKA